MSVSNLKLSLVSPKHRTDGYKIQPNKFMFSAVIWSLELHNMALSIVIINKNIFTTKTTFPITVLTNAECSIF